MAVQHDVIELQVVSDLANAGVLEQRPQPLEDRRAASSWSGAEALDEQVAAGIASLVPDRARSGPADRAVEKAMPDDRRAHGRRSVGDHAQREFAGGRSSATSASSSSGVVTRR